MLVMHKEESAQLIRKTILEHTPKTETTIISNWYVGLIKPLDDAFARGDWVEVRALCQYYEQCCARYEDEPLYLRITLDG